MFDTKAAAHEWFTNNGNLDGVDLDCMDEIIENLYRNANTEEQADEIISLYVI